MKDRNERVIIRSYGRNPMKAYHQEAIYHDRHGGHLIYYES